MLLLGVLSLGVFSDTSSKLAALKWIIPEGYSWGQIDASSQSSLPVEVEWSSFASTAPVFVEYRIDAHESSTPWTRLSASSARGLRSGSSHLSGSIPSGVLQSDPGVHYVEARLSNGETQGPSSAAFYAIGPVEPLGLFDSLKKAFEKVKSTLKLSVQAAPAALPPLPHLSVMEGNAAELVDRIKSLSEQVPAITFSWDVEPLGRLEYSIGDNGEWQHAGDFPKGEVKVALPLSGFPQSLAPGSEVPIRLRAFNGVSWTAQANQPVITAVVNAPPTLSLVDSRPVVLSGSAGEDVTLPVSVRDADKDPLHVLCIFDGGAKVTAVAHDGGDRVVLPASVFEGQLTAGAHSVEVLAFDGHDINENRVSVGYYVKDNAEEAKLGALTPVAIGGIVVGGVALMAIGAVIVVVTRKTKKEKESSTGLIESE
jgi:hypothetical protein